MALLSFATGYTLIHLMIREPDNTTSRTPIVHSESLSDAPDSVIFEDSDDDDGSDMDGENEIPVPTGDTPEVPPGPAPDGIRLNGVPLYFRCWDREGHRSTECDRLTVLEKRMATRLYRIAECRSEHSDGTFGLLSLGTHLDLSAHTIRFWSAPSSTIANAKQIGHCVRTHLAGLPLHDLSNRFEKYRIFFTVEFFDPKQHTLRIAELRRTGRQVEVIMDRVRVREEPEDGPVLGRINSGVTVTLLNRNDTRDWCHILTPANRKGWIICEALKL